MAVAKIPQKVVVNRINNASRLTQKVSVLFTFSLRNKDPSRSRLDQDNILYPEEIYETGPFDPMSTLLTAFDCF